MLPTGFCTHELPQADIAEKAELARLQKEWEEQVSQSNRLRTAINDSAHVLAQTRATNSEIMEDNVRCKLFIRQLRLHPTPPCPPAARPKGSNKQQGNVQCHVASPRASSSADITKMADDVKKELHRMLRVVDEAMIQASAAAMIKTPPNEMWVSEQAASAKNDIGIPRMETSTLRQLVSTLAHPDADVAPTGAASQQHSSSVHSTSSPPPGTLPPEPTRHAVTHVGATPSSPERRAAPQATYMSPPSPKTRCSTPSSSEDSLQLQVQKQVPKKQHTHRSITTQFYEPGPLPGTVVIAPTMQVGLIPLPAVSYQGIPDPKAQPRAPRVPPVPVPMGFSSESALSGPALTKGEVFTVGDAIRTLIVKNVPAHMTKEKLLQLWPPAGSYNMLHLPFSPNRHRRVAYTFVNFISTEALLQFRERWHGVVLVPDVCAKPLDVRTADVQGYENNLRNMRSNSRIMNEQLDHYLPAIILQDGTVANFREVMRSLDDEGIQAAYPVSNKFQPQASGAQISEEKLRVWVMAESDEAELSEALESLAIVQTEEAAFGSE